jgi:hypothetical protein
MNLSEFFFTTYCYIFKKRIIDFRWSRAGRVHSWLPLNPNNVKDALMYFLQTVWLVLPKLLVDVFNSRVVQRFIDFKTQTKLFLIFFLFADMAFLCDHLHILINILIICFTLLKIKLVPFQNTKNYSGSKKKRGKVYILIKVKLFSYYRLQRFYF